MNITLPGDANADEILETFVRFGRAVGCSDDELRNAITRYASDIAPEYTPADFINDPWAPLPF